MRKMILTIADLVSSGRSSRIDPEACQQQFQTTKTDFENMKTKMAELVNRMTGITKLGFDAVFSVYERGNYYIFHLFVNLSYHNITSVF